LANYSQVTNAGDGGYDLSGRRVVYGIARANARAGGDGISHDRSVNGRVWPVFREKRMSAFKYFKLSDFNCQETGENEMDLDFIMSLDELREACGFPFVITSGYRSPRHSLEAKKSSPGQHAQGIAADIAVSGGAQRWTIVTKAIEQGFTGIGVAKTFIHVDRRDSSPMLWTYV